MTLLWFLKIIAKNSLFVREPLLLSFIAFLILLDFGCPCKELNIKKTPFVIELRYVNANLVKLLQEKG